MTCPDKPITAADVKKFTMNARFFGDMDDGGYVQSYVCNEHPALEKMVYRETRHVNEVVTYGVDGEEVPRDLNAIAQALNNYYFPTKGA